MQYTNIMTRLHKNRKMFTSSRRLHIPNRLVDSTLAGNGEGTGFDSRLGDREKLASKN